MVSDEGTDRDDASWTKHTVENWGKEAVNE
jgi:hypothetical protein